jgi:predicted GNAT superfamily acetyltransferase
MCNLYDAGQAWYSDIMHIRNIEVSDYRPVITVLNEWWGGRHMSDMLPKLFFVHFSSTGFIAEEDGSIIGFLVGFISQTRPDEAYIHFSGVHPDFRKRGIARTLYDRFFAAVRSRGCREVRCVTSIVNKTSIAFHTALGFRIEPGDAMTDGASYHPDYDGPGEHRVLFLKDLQWNA